MKIQRSIGFFVEINEVDNGDVTALVRDNQGRPIEEFFTLKTLAEWIKAIPNLASKEQDK